MALSWEKLVERWQAAGVVDAAAAERIRAFEATQDPSERLRWPVVLAVALGGVLLCAGVLLFVAAHWDDVSPVARFSLVLFMVAIFPVAGALTAERFRALSTTFYAVGTICAGAGIFLSAQIFNLEEHWPSGILLWALAALAGFLLLRDWVQPTLLALLAPAWLAGEWWVRTAGYAHNAKIPSEGLLLLALTYFTARTIGNESTIRKALVWIGGIMAIPFTFSLIESDDYYSWMYRMHLLPIPLKLLVVGWVVVLGIPLALAIWLRGKAAALNVLTLVWVLVLGTMKPGRASEANSLVVYAWHSLGPYIWCAAGSIGLIVWGVAEKRRERINLGVIGFALTIFVFYFSNVMDKLGRSASLIGFGAIFLIGGWSLERVRRRLIARLKESAA